MIHRECVMARRLLEDNESDADGNVKAGDGEEMVVLTLSPTQRAGFRMDPDGSVLVVHPATIAEEASLRTGDRIMAIDGVRCSEAFPPLQLWSGARDQPTRQLSVRRAIIRATTSIPVQLRVSGSAAATAAHEAEEKGLEEKRKLLEEKRKLGHEKVRSVGVTSPYSPHAVMNAYVQGGRLDLADVLSTIDDFDAPRRCYICHEVAKPVRACGRCKAVVYCTQKCQRFDWTVGPPRSAQALIPRTPHQLICSQALLHLSKVTATAKLSSFFPWLRLTSSNFFPEEAVLAALGLLGTSKGYWTRADTRTPHGGPDAPSKGYGALLAHARHPQDDEGWLLPVGQFPLLHQLSPEVCPQPLHGRALRTWPEYYAWRGLPPSSIVALRLHHVMLVSCSLQHWSEALSPYRPLYAHTHTHTHRQAHAHTQRERERERERDCNHATAPKATPWSSLSVWHLLSRCTMWSPSCLSSCRRGSSTFTWWARRRSSTCCRSSASLHCCCRTPP